MPKKSIGHIERKANNDITDAKDRRDLAAKARAERLDRRLWTAVKVTGVLAVGAVGLTVKNNIDDHHNGPTPMERAIDRNSAAAEQNKATMHEGQQFYNTGEDSHGDIIKFRDRAHEGQVLEPGQQLAPEQNPQPTEQDVINLDKIK